MAFGTARGVKTPSQDPRYDALDGTAPANTARWGKNAAPIQQKSDAWWDQQAGQSALDQEAAGKQQQQAYDIMHAQALGGATAAQGMLQSGTANQQAALTGLAAGAGGGARGAAAAQGTALGATANAGMMGAANLDMQRNSDMLAGQSMQNTMAGQMRNQDQRNLGLTNDNNYDRSKNALDWQGMNDQNALFYAGLAQDQAFGEAGFQQDRQRMQNTSQWNAHQLENSNIGGAIGAGIGAAQGIGKQWSADNQGVDVNHDGDPSNDTISSDVHVKEQVRKDSYQEGYEDAHAAYRDLYGLNHAHPEVGYGKTAPAADKAVAATGMEPPAPPKSKAPLTAAQQKLADDARGAFAGTVGAFGTPSVFASPPPQAADPQAMPTQFGGMMGAFGSPSPLAAKAYGPAATAPPQPSDVPQFGGMMAALDQPAYQFTSDEETKQKVRRDAAADLYDRGRDAAQHADYDAAYTAFTTANGLVPHPQARDAAAKSDKQGRDLADNTERIAKHQAAQSYDAAVAAMKDGDFYNASQLFASANATAPNAKAEAAARAMNDKAASKLESRTKPPPPYVPISSPPPSPVPSLPTPTDAPPMIAMASDERQKADRGDGSDSFLQALSRGRASYTYKDPSLEPNPNGEKGGRYLGVMAQDVERVPEIGHQLVTDTPTGKKINIPSMVSALSAGSGALYDQQIALEERMRRLEKRR